MNRLLAWWRSGHLKRLEANARYFAVAYAAARERYENALIAERVVEDKEDVK